MAPNLIKFNAFKTKNFYKFNQLITEIKAFVNNEAENKICQ